MPIPQVERPTRLETYVEPEGWSRVPAMDFLRFASIFSIMFWHAALPYSSDFEWFGFRGRSSYAMDIAIWGTVGFTIQLVFVVSGFSTCRSLAQQGVAATAMRRLRRLLIPLVGMAIVFNAAVAVAVTTSHDHSLAPTHALTFFWRFFALYHLWFVYYLVIITFSVLGLIHFAASLRSVAFLRAMVPASPFSRIASAPEIPLGTASVLAALLGFSIVTACLTFAENGVGNAILRDPSLLTSPIKVFTPSPWLLLYYAVFFSFGWLLAKRNAMLGTLASHWHWLLPLGLLCRVASYYILRFPDRSIPFSFGVDFITGVFSWSLVGGLVGAALVFVPRQHYWLNYLSGASYWNYLIHLLVLLGVQLMLYRIDLPIPVSYLILVGVTMAILLSSYEFLVRRSWLSRFLGESPALVSGSGRLPVLTSADHSRQ